MASIISAGTTSATALNMSADTSGVLSLASNNGTVALTIDTSQNISIPSTNLVVGTSTNNVNSRLFVDNSINTNYSGIIGMRYNVSGQTNAYYKGMAGINVSSGSARGLHLFNYDQDSNQGINFWPAGAPGGVGSSSVYALLDSNATFTTNCSSSNAMNIAYGGAWSSGNANFVTMYMSGMTGGTAGVALGKSGGTYNTSKIIFGYAGNNSTSNYLGLGFWDADARLTIYPTGNAFLTGSLTQNTSDDRLKTDFEIIKDALSKVRSLSGFTHAWNDLAVKLNNADPAIRESGVSAQKVKEVLPEAVCIAPFDQVKGNRFESESGENYLTVMYEKLVPLLIEAVKELEDKVITLEAKVGA